MDASVKAYLREIGRRGGQRSRRRLSSQAAREMVRVREARRFYRLFHDRCFWNAPEDFLVGKKDVDWVTERLRQHGGRSGWEAAARLCR